MAAERFSDMERPAVFIMDLDRRIQLVTPAAEDLLGWSDDQVRGMECMLLFDCRDSEGASLCDRCRFREAIDQQGVTQSMSACMADRFGDRHEVSMSFWLLPPAGRIRDSRLMGVVRSANAEQDGRADTTS